MATERSAVVPLLADDCWLFLDEDFC